ncbi:PRD domain-containing protein [Haloplasma contractile]|uniref:Transcription antiterminator GlcT protein n=1 Tax=Haloplasma contractile SSD-17B TaxID=1033810 RepID=U2DXV4_9MOLU|nr:PRD domain-containing protein [Haloplasma contractile]ERJ13092.1 Transcription antiterminator GlcT protein [Haloplasma contractile SSD-17B]
MVAIKGYEILKVLSNNVVLVREGDAKSILVGKGIGFAKKKGQVISNKDVIEDKFISLDALNDRDEAQFFAQVDPRVIEITEDIIIMASEELGESLNPNIHIGLIDHINYAIKRLNEGIEIVNPFLNETKFLYPKEYDIAEKAVTYISSTIDINIPVAEIGFIALHIHGGRSNSSKSKAMTFTKLISNLTKFVEDKLKISFDDYSFMYSRFVIHLQGVFDRVLNEQTLENIFLDKIMIELPYEVSLSKTIGMIIEKELGKPVPDSEIGYIALHISKLNFK